MDAGEGIYQGLAALASGIARRKQLDYESELQRQAQDVFSRLSRGGFTTESVPYEQRVNNPFFGIQGIQETQPPSQETVATPLDPRLVSLMGQLAGNPQGQGLLNTFLGARAQAQPKIGFVNQEGGGLQQTTQYPSGRVSATQLIPSGVSPTGSDWTLSDGDLKHPSIRKTPGGGYEQLYEKTVGGRKLLKYETLPNAPGGMGSGFYNPEDPKAIADAIIRGEQPPTTSGLYRGGLPVRGELARRHYDLSTANRDWTAINRYLSTLNGPQQVRLKQAIEFTHDSLDQIETLYGDLVKFGLPSGFKVWNAGALAAAKNLPGEPGATAQALQAQINDMISELAVVYKGGNASTDESLKIAAENLKADWNPETFKKAMKALRTNLTIRKNSIINATPTQVSPDSPYLPPTGAAPTKGEKKTITLPDGTVITEE